MSAGPGGRAASITFDESGFPSGVAAKINDAAIAEWIEERLNDARNLFVRQMGRGGGGGRTYGRHRASAPGEYPATDTGRLANATDYRMTGPREGVLGSDIEYATYLAFGTRKMAPRKMYVDALEEVMATRAGVDALVQAVEIEWAT